MKHLWFLNIKVSILVLMELELELRGGDSMLTVAEMFLSLF